MAQRFNNCLFFEASAKLKVNVDKIFHELIRAINKKSPTKEKPKKKGCLLL